MRAPLHALGRPRAARWAVVNHAGDVLARFFSLSAARRYAWARGLSVEAL